MLDVDDDDLLLELLDDPDCDDDNPPLVAELAELAELTLLGPGSDCDDSEDFVDTDTNPVTLDHDCHDDQEDHDETPEGGAPGSMLKSSDDVS